MELPKEEFDEGKRGLPERAMYVTRDAVQSWEMEYTEMMVGAGFGQGSCSACVLYREECSSRCSWR